LAWRVSTAVLVCKPQADCTIAIIRMCNVYY